MELANLIPVSHHCSSTLPETSGVGNVFIEGLLIRDQVFKIRTHSSRMLEIAGHTRRSVLRLGATLLLNGAVIRGFGFGRVSSLEQVARSVPVGSAGWHYRQYVVHAGVMIGSIPIFSKQGVGGAAIALEEASQSESAVTSLQLTAGSWPARLKGFNRFGATQEVVREEKGAVAESAYLSFMASSREKGLADARKAFTSGSATQTFTVARGRATDVGCAFKLQHQTLDARYTWSNSDQVLDELDAQNFLPPQKPVPDYGPGCLPTFLFAIRRAISQGGGGTSSYVHNDKVFRLRIESKADANSGHRLITGWTAEAGERSETEFKLWLAVNDPVALPDKIEFRPRGFLKLTLEADGSAPIQALKPILGKNRG